MENVKDWLDKKGYYNSGLRTDRNHRIDLYLSDVLEEYRTELLNIHNVVGQSEQLVCKCGLPKDKKGGNFNCMRTDCDMPIAN